MPCTPTCIFRPVCLTFATTLRDCSAVCVMGFSQ